VIIIGVDFHPEFQQIAFVDTDAGELEKRRLHRRWLEWLFSELQIELRVGDAAEMRAKWVQKQKTDRHDAQFHLEADAQG